MAKASYDGFLNLGLGEKMRDFGDLLCVLDLEKRAGVEKELNTLREKALGYESALGGWSPFGWLYKFRLRSILTDIALLEDDGLPQFLLYYNPWPDHFAHFKGPFSDEIISPSGELNRLDYWLGRIQDVYRNAGLGGRTLYAMAGDHGLTPVYHLINPEVEVFEALRERGIPLVVEKISSDEGEGPKITNPRNPPTMKGKDVVIASTAGGNYMMDFFLDQGAKWRRQPVYSELTRWKTLSGHTLNIPGEILAVLKDTLDYMAVRESFRDPENHVTRLIGAYDGKRRDLLIHRRGNRIFLQGHSLLLDLEVPSFYQSFGHGELRRRNELLERCLKRAQAASVQSWCTEEEWRELANFSPRPDSVVQLAHLYDTDLAGTINLFPKAGIGYNSRVPGRHAGEHFHEKDAFVGFWGEMLRPGRRLPTAVNGSLAPTIFEHITGVEPETGKDGWGFPSLYREAGGPPRQ